MRAAYGAKLTTGRGTCTACHVVLGQGLPCCFRCPLVSIFLAEIGNTLSADAPMVSQSSALYLPVFFLSRLVYTYVCVRAFTYWCRDRRPTSCEELVFFVVCGDVVDMRLFPLKGDRKAHSAAHSRQRGRSARTCALSRRLERE